MNNNTYFGHIPRKSFGQFFLRDQHIINAIVSIIKPKIDQELVEIGPGLAALTEPVSNFLNHLTVIEIDRNLSDRLRANPLINSKLVIYQKDAMSINFSELSKKIGQQLRIYGNLPYNISIPFILHLFNHINYITDMHFMLQKEVADRLAAKVNSKSYCRLSIIAQYYCQVVLLIDIPPKAFFPYTKVNSTLVRLLPHAITSNSVHDISILRHIIKKAFNQRRKMISNSLSQLLDIDTLIKLGINPMMRAENISITEYCQIANFLSQK